MINKNTKNFFKIKIINTISRIFLSSFIIVSFFYIIPMFINFTENNSIGLSHSSLLESFP